MSEQEIIPASAPIGRPLTYSDEIATIICDRLAADECSLSEICREDDMPSLSTVYRWRRDIPAFRENYTRAREDQGHSVADKIRDVREQVRSGVLAPDQARVIADTIKWESGKRAPKDFGDKLDLTSSDGTMSPKGLEDFYAQPTKED
jgi:hypothetical protein